MDDFVMNDTLHIDTLAFSKRLKDAGADEKLADAIAEGISQVDISNLATKADLETLKQALYNQISDLRDEIKDRNIVVDNEFTSLRNEMKIRDLNINHSLENILIEMREKDASLHKEMNEKNASLHKKMNEMHTSLRNEIRERDELLRKDIKERDVSLRNEIRERDELLRKDMKISNFQIVFLLGSIIVLGLTIMTGLIKFWQVIPSP